MTPKLALLMQVEAERPVEAQLHLSLKAAGAVIASDLLYAAERGVFRDLVGAYRRLLTMFDRRMSDADPWTRILRFGDPTRVSAVARIDSTVRLATMAPAGPEVPAAKNTPMASRSSWVPPGCSEKPRPRNTSDAAEYPMAVVHLRIGTCRLSRSVTIPQTIMPTPMSMIAIAATPAASSGAMP